MLTCFPYLAGFFFFTQKNSFKEEFLIVHIITYLALSIINNHLVIGG